MLAERRSSPSPSPSRGISIGSKISAIGARLSRRLSNASDSQQNQNEVLDSISPMLDRTRTNTERSISRGREGFTSTGRGGIGNIRHASLSRDGRSELGPDDFSPTRGRELVNPSQVFSTGRGGAGNFRSPSRDPVIVDLAEQELIREYTASKESTVYSTGRGGIGNINRSRSRDPTSSIDRSCSRDSAQVHSLSRGRAGNIHPGDGIIAETIDENERRPSNQDGYRSTSRGGAANTPLSPETAIEHHANSVPQFMSTGRGGSGNIVAHRSLSRPRP